MLAAQRVRTTIVADERVLERLRQLPRARGTSMGAIIREALEEKVAREQPPITFAGTAGPRRPEDVPVRMGDEGEAYVPADFRGQAWA